MTISNKIYNLRQEHNLSQKEFAEKIGTSQASVNYWENSKRSPKIEQVQKIASVFNIPISSLIDIDNYTKEEAKLLNIDEEKLAKIKFKETAETFEKFCDMYCNLDTQEQTYLARSLEFIFKEISNNQPKNTKKLLSLLDKILFSFANLIILNKKYKKNISNSDMDNYIYYMQSILEIPFKIKDVYHSDTDK